VSLESLLLRDNHAEPQTRRSSRTRSGGYGSPTQTLMRRAASLGRSNIGMSAGN